MISFPIRFFLLNFIAICSISAKSDVTTDVTSAIRFKVEKFQLSNGLTVLIHEDPTLPIISYHQWFRVGSRDEKPGRTGLAHFFEHLMFKGTPKYPGGVLDRLIQANGGTINAFTSKDYTGYYVNFPSDKLELAIDIDSDRMRNLIFSEEKIQSEREVVKEERRFRIENNIGGMLQEALYNSVFKVHPYRWPTIGSMRDLNDASMEDLKEFYRVYYAPNNAVVVIAGNVSSQHVKKLIAKYYGDIPAQPLPERNKAVEPEQKNERSVTLTRQVDSAVFALSYPIMKAGEPSSYAMDLLSHILAGDESSRLYRKLVYRDQLSTGVSSSSYTPMDPGIFDVTVRMKMGVDMERTINLAMAEIYKFRQSPVSEAELEKAKNQAIFAYVSGLKTISGKAHALALNEVMFGNYEMLFNDLGLYMKVTSEDIQKVAQEYLLPTRRNVVRIIPKPSTPAGEQNAHTTM